MEKKMETTISLGFREEMAKKMETTISGLGLRV